MIRITRTLFNGKSILITGGAGSLGQALTKRILGFEPKVIRVFDNGENALFEMQGNFQQPNLRFLLGDVRDKQRLNTAMKDIDIVFHLAALKHVMSCEYNPFEAVKTNILGTQNVIEAAMEHDVEKVIYTSTDKATNPSNAMGATKLMAERLMTSANYYKGKYRTIFASVRFGNVIGTNGSVVPVFNKQILQGGPITITDSSMTRFLLTSEEALKLVFKCTELARAGETFVMKMPVMKITDLAEVMSEELAPKHGFKPGQIEIKHIEIKPGEKLYEELVTEEESTRTIETGDMYIILPQIKELIPERYKPDFLKYYAAKKAQLEIYCSDKIKPLSKEELKEILKKENLI